MRSFLNLFGFATLALSSSIHADVGIYSGAEVQSAKVAEGSVYKNISTVTRASGRVYFLCDFIDGASVRTVEVRIHGKQYRVRGERTLKLHRFIRGTQTSRTFEYYFTSVGQTDMPDKSFSIMWQGTSAPVPGGNAHNEYNPKTGLPKISPTTFSSRQEFFATDEDFQTGFNYEFLKRTASVSLNAAISKECNDAGDNLDAALARLKSRLEASGYTASSSVNDPLN